MAPTRLMTASLIVSALAIGSAITAHLPSSDTVSEAPFERHAALNEQVTMRNGQLVVTQVEGARSIAGDSGSFTSQALFVLITLRHAGSTQPHSVLTPYLLDADGRRFSTASTALGTCTLAQPNLPQECGVVFEVAPDTLAGATLQVPAEGFTEGAGDDLAVIDLGITSDHVSGWQQRTDTLKVTPASIVGEK